MNQKWLFRFSMCMGEGTQKNVKSQIKNYRNPQVKLRLSELSPHVPYVLFCTHRSVHFIEYRSGG